MSIFLEITNNLHGGGPDEIWGLGNALWSPTQAKNGADVWKTMRDVKAGDIVYHSVKIDGRRHVLFGKSIAAGSFVQTKERPNAQSEWASDEYYRVPLKHFDEFQVKVETRDFIRANRNELVQRTNSFFTSNFDVAQKYLVQLQQNDAILLEKFVENPVPESNILAEISSNSIIRIIKKEFDDNNLKQLILTGAPGTGKTYSAISYVEEELGDEFHTSGRFKFVQFHPSYDYTDFVEGIRPINDNGNMKFVKRDGVFKSFCRNAASDLNNHYYFVIDEINRADLSKVFGELMYCLEEDYRGKKGEIATQYQNLTTYGLTEEDIFQDGFYIPDNVFIIGTMNDIDRSVESFDFALRRRFRWINIKVEDVLTESLNNMWKKPLFDNMISAITKMNHVISGEIGHKLGLDDNYQVGHAYFKPTNDTNLKDYMEKVWKTRIESLLREYVRGRKADLVEVFINECKSALLSL